jgi:hypothetical protein
MKQLPTASLIASQPIRITGQIIEVRATGIGRWSVTLLTGLGHFFTGAFPSSATGPILGAEVTLLVVPSTCHFTSAVELLDPSKSPIAAEPTSPTSRTLAQRLAEPRAPLPSTTHPLRMAPSRGARK